QSNLACALAVYSVDDDPPEDTVPERTYDGPVLVMTVGDKVGRFDTQQETPPLENAPGVPRSLSQAILTVAGIPEVDRQYFSIRRFTLNGKTIYGAIYRPQSNNPVSPFNCK